MGRTTPTSTQLIDTFERQLSAYAHTLRIEDREALQCLLAMIRDQSAAISELYADLDRQRQAGDTPTYFDPFVAFAVSMFIGLMQRVTQLEEGATAREAIIDVEARHET